MGVGQTYSFKSLTGVYTNLVYGITIPLTGGNLGVGAITITMAQDRTTHDVAADGTVMPSYIAGDNGSANIEVQETSDLHEALLSAYNLAKLAADNDDVSGWAAGVLSFVVTNTGQQHLCTGVSFRKIPDKPYQAQGQKITWDLMCANIVNL